jgi:putative spermidine/putrescine transport system permease protein
LAAIVVLAGPVVVGGLYSFAASFGLIGTGSSGFTLTTWQEVLRAGATWRSVGWTLMTGAMGTALAFAAAVAVARGAAGSLIARQLALIPLAVPHVAGALAVLLLLGQSGFLSRAAFAAGWIDGPAAFPALVYDRAGIGLTLAFAWKEFPFLLLNAIAVLDSRDRSLEEMARSLGADASQAWRRVTWPLLWRGMAPAVIAVFAFLVGQYEMAVLLAPSDPLPLSMLTQERAVDPELARRGAAHALALVALLLTTALVLVHARVTARDQEMVT